MERIFTLYTNGLETKSSDDEYFLEGYITFQIN
jgi:hypothetical protein